MNRIAITLMLMLLTAGLLGCGGGGTGAPAPDDGNTEIDENPVVIPVGPSEVVGSHSTSVLPDQLNVLTGASAEALGAQLGKFGISVLNKSGGWATVQLPAGMDLDWAAAELKKEYNIATAEKVNVLQTPRVSYTGTEAYKASSYLPNDPMYADYYYATGSTRLGQALAMDTMGFQAAWDVLLGGSVGAREVRIAIIGAGFWPEAGLTSWSPLDIGIIDTDHTGFVDTDGTVTTGLAETEWEIFDDADPLVYDEPYDDAASLMLGLLADDIGDPADPLSGSYPRYYDLDGEEDVDPEEIWNEGAAGANPTATYVLIKTGQIGTGNVWEYTDNHIAEAIDYAAAASDDDNGGLWPNGGCEADIILLSMFAEGVVGGNVSTAILNARDGDALVIAPAGDVVATAQFDGEGVFTGWGDIPLQIDADPVTPGSDPNCIAVCATGADRVGDLGQVTVDEVLYDNTGWGWWPNFVDPFDHSYTEIASTYANTGGDIAAMGFGLGWRFDPVFRIGDGTEGDPYQYAFFGYNYTSSFNRFSSVYSAAYVAGAASIVHQALHEANNVEPTDDEVWAVLTNVWNFAPMTGLLNNGGYLNAGAAAMNAIEGGSLYTPAMYLDGVVVSQLPNYVEIETDFEMTPTVQLGTDPFTIRVNWDNGEDELEQPWDNGTPVTLTDGWDTLGLKGINIEIEDADGQLVTFDLQIHVVGRLGAGITINDVNGTLVLPSTLAAGLNYRFNANPTNLYTGEIDGEPNVTTFSWDFDGDGTEDATGTSPAYGYPAAGDYTLELLVTETVRPSILFTMDVNVS